MQAKVRAVKFSFVMSGFLFIGAISTFIFTGITSPSSATVSLPVQNENQFDLSSDDVTILQSSQTNTDTIVNDNEVYNLQAQGQEIIARYGSDVIASNGSALMMVAPSTADAQVVEPEKAAPPVEEKKPIGNCFVNADALNIRSGAGTDFEKIASLKRGDKIGLIDKTGEWARVQTSSGKIGYTLSEYLVDNEKSVEKAAAAIINEVKQPTSELFVNASTLNVRSGASTEYDKVATLTRGEKVGFYGKNGEWAKIKTSSGKIGYTLYNYLVDSESSVDRAAPAATATSNEVTTLAQQIADYSTNFQGVKYVYGSYSTSGMDCSGFVKYVYAHFSIAVPRSAADYAGFGEKVSRENLRVSDILLFDTDKNGTVGHVGIYLGGDKFIHASTSKRKVIIMTLSEYRGKYYGARRVID